MLRCFVALMLASCLQTVCAAKVLSIAHRGDSLFAPENTLAAFQSAVPKADLVEFDVQVSIDGQLMVMHDSSVDRTTEGTGSLAGKTSAELKQLDAGSWFSPLFAGERVPTMAEALATILPNSIPLIEQKAGTPAVYSAELRRLNLVTNVIVQSFNWSFLTSLRALEPQLKLAALGSGPITGSVLTNVIKTGALTLAWEKSSITPAEVQFVHAAGLKLFVWTVDGAEIDRFVAMGVDGIISNDPGRVRSADGETNELSSRLADSLVAYWPFDEGLSAPSTRLLSDAWGANHGTVTAKAGTTPWVTNGEAKFGSAIQVEGNNLYAEVPSTSALDIHTNAVTISAWVKLRTLPSSIPESFAGIFDSVQDSYALYLDKSAQELKFKVTTSNGDAARPGIRQSALATNEWLHIVGTYTGQAGPVSGQATIYLNGVAADVHTAGDSGGGVGLTGLVKAGQTAALGRNGTQTSYPFHGVIDDLAIWSRSLSAAEVKLLFLLGSDDGASLKDLLRDPIDKLLIVSAGWVGTSFQVSFQSTGPWVDFILLHSQRPEGPFTEVHAAQQLSPQNGAKVLTWPQAPRSSDSYFRVAPRW